MVKPASAGLVSAVAIHERHCLLLEDEHGTVYVVLIHAVVSQAVHSEAPSKLKVAVGAWEHPMHVIAPANE